MRSRAVLVVNFAVHFVVNFVMALAMAGILVTEAGAALAAAPGDLDPSGRLVLAGAAWSLSLDTPDPVVTVLELGIRPTDGAAAYVDDPAGLEGTGALRMGGHYERAAVDLAALEGALSGRRVEIRLWTRALGTDLTAWVQWLGDGPLGYSALRVPLVMTGRATDDGWVELSTGPVDFDFGGVLPARWLMLQDAGPVRGRDPLFGAARFALDDDARVAVDGLHVLDHGPAAVPASPCALPEADEVCGAAGACFVGRCVDSAVVAGRPPLAREARAAAVERRLFELRVFQGERNRHAALDAIEPAARALADGPPGAFYPGLRGLIASGRFGHVQAPLAGLGTSFSAGLCFGPGDADLLPDSPRVPLIFWADPDWPPTAALRPGDALVAVDGLSVDAWLERADELPLSFRADVAMARWGMLWNDLALRGARLTFARCPGAGDAPCRADQVENVDVALADAFGGLLFGPVGEAQPPPAGADCDLRFGRASGARPDGAWQSVAVQDRPDGVRILQINGFPLDVAWTSAVREALGGGRDRLLIDHRWGLGGSSTAVLDVTTPLTEASQTGAFVELADLALDAPGVREFVDVCLADGLDDDSCRSVGVGRQPVRRPGGPAPLAGARVAVLTGLDASGSEHFLLYLRRRSAPLRLFGLGTTEGDLAQAAFTPAHDGEERGTYLQLHDLAPLPDGAGPLPAEPEFLSNTGVTSDVVCVQSQRDAVQGVDTCLEEAIRWLAE